MHHALSVKVEGGKCPQDVADMLQGQVLQVAKLNYAYSYKVVLCWECLKSITVKESDFALDFRTCLSYNSDRYRIDRKQSL